MRFVPSSHPPGTVGVISSTLARYIEFITSLEALRVPEGTSFCWASGADTAENCNNLVSKMTGEWLWILGDDHVFKADLLERLLGREVDVVAPVVCRRHPPFIPVAYSVLNHDQRDWRMFVWPQLSIMRGLIDVAGIGSAGMLVRKRVLDAIPVPHFEIRPSGGRKQFSEDLDFSLKVIEAGFPIFLDLDQSMGHITNIALWPTRDDQGMFAISGDVCGYHVSVHTPEGKLHPLDVMVHHTTT